MHGWTSCKSSSSGVPPHCSLAVLMRSLGPSFRVGGFPSRRFVRDAAGVRPGWGGAGPWGRAEPWGRAGRAQCGAGRAAIALPAGPAEAAPRPPFCAVEAAGGAIGEAAAAGSASSVEGAGAWLWGAAGPRRARGCALQFGLFGSASLKVVTFTLGPRREHCDEIGRLRRGLVLGGRWKVKWLQNWVNSLVVCIVCSKVFVKADTWEIWQTPLSKCESLVRAAPAST